MKAKKAVFPVLLLVAALLIPCAAASAKNLTFGPPLTGNWEAAPCAKAACTFVNSEFDGAAPSAASPVDGLIVGFSVVGGSTAGTYQVRTAEPLGGGLAFDFTGIGASVAAVPTAGVRSYDTSLPVKAGQMIGLTVGGGASMAFGTGGQYAEWVVDVPASGRSVALKSWPENVGYDVEIQPAPTIEKLTATSGPTAGGTALTIVGADLEGASSVTFGSVPARNVELQSPSRIAVVVPPGKAAGSVAVAVTTRAGTGGGARFNYVAPGSSGSESGSGSKGSSGSASSRCVVPNLKGKHLAAAKKALVKAHCVLGEVTKLAGATTKSGKVTKQGAKPGTRLASGAKVAVTLKPR